MSTDKKNTTGYSTSDLQKYWRGELSAREMHELESAALEDPFLADALEGMELQLQQTLSGSPLPGSTPAEPADCDPDLLDLQLRLQQRVARKTMRPPVRIWTRWAAAAIIFIGMGSIAYYTLINRSAQKISLAKSKSAAPISTDSAIYPPPATSAATTPAQQVTPKQTTAAVAPKTTPREQAAAAPRTIPGQQALATAHKQLPATLRKADNEQATAATPTAATPELAKEKLKKDTAHQLAATEALPAPPAALGIASTPPRQPFGNANAIGSNRYKQNLPNHLAFSGKVLDENNHPLAGASVYLNGQGNINTMTDRKGYFNLPLRPLDSTVNVMVAYKGYEPTSITLNNGDPSNQYNITGNIIRLQPQQASLDELKVTGYGTHRTETFIKMADNDEEKIDSLWLRATPVPGKLTYLNYLQTASKRLSLDSTKKGTEAISFIVNRKGELSSFKIQQSLSPAHDSAAIRLIQEGPSWKLLRGRQTRTSVRISF